MNWTDAFFHEDQAETITVSGCEISWQYDDGGRAAAGFKGKAGDCVTRAIAIATGMSYADAYRAVNEFCATETCRGRSHKSSARTGVKRTTTRKLLAELGWRWTATMGIGTGCRVHLRRSELPPGKIIVSLSKHIVAVVDGVVHDTYDPSRAGTRCVYGYYQPPTGEGLPK